MSREPLRVLVADDERLSRQTSVRQLREAGFEAMAVDNAFQAMDIVAESSWDVLLVDLRMPGMDGLELLRKLQEDQPGVDVIMMTAYATVETAVAAMREGAADYLTKPFRFHELEHRLRKIAELRHYRREVHELRTKLDEKEEDCGLVGRSDCMEHVRGKVRSFSHHEAPVLITGETGTGKEVVARAIHRLGSRRGRPFVAVACGAIPHHLAESELFGHERGAFTGATGQRIGTLERAHGGTLLLDDVDDLPLGLQAKLLRALQEGTFVRVGAERELTVDVRVVATTKRDLATASSEGTFRDDLYYRLRGLEIRLPPLRERREDILLLAQHFLHRCGEAQGRTELHLEPEAARCLRDHAWPGNVRELAHTVEAAVTLCPDGRIRLEHLPDDIGRTDDGTDSLFSLHLEGVDRVPLNELVQRIERRLIQWALRRAEGRQTRAAEILGLARTTLQSKLERGGDVSG